MQNANLGAERVERDQRPRALLGMAPGQWREAGHRFEWPRSRFRAWAAGVALRRRYAVRIAGIAPEDPRVGSPTQWARFDLWERLRAAPSGQS